jgi:hypothetical protein
MGKKDGNDCLKPAAYATKPVATGQKAVDELVNNGTRPTANGSEAGDGTDSKPKPTMRVSQLGQDRRQVCVARDNGQEDWYQIVGSKDDAKIYDDRPRAYRSSPLPAIAEQCPDTVDTQAVLLKMYDVSFDGWRVLTDVRFKLLALLPALSVIAWSQIVPNENLRVGAGVLGGLAIGLLGLLITVGLVIYDHRNNELYNDLASRCRRIEFELGVDTGPFRGRLKPQRPGISHGTATSLVYWAVVAGWLLVILWFVLLGLDVVDADSLAPAAQL